MSGVTITAGVSFSGAFTFTEAPLQNTAAWFGGGSPGPSSTVDRITFATDTATASVRGPLSAINRQEGAVGNSDYAWFGGGLAPGNPSGGKSTVDRITYATDTATASVRGPLSLARYKFLAAVGNSDYGWFGGGYAYPGIVYSRIDRITYATDTATASIRGPLSSARYQLAAAGNTTDGWFGGGYEGSPRATVDRITYATDTATASVRGPLSLARYALAAAGNTTDAWFGGGATPATVSTVDRITYATDTATASVRGPLSAGRLYFAAAGNTTDGWFGGGSPGPSSTVERITYATDTATASVRGPLSSARDLLAAAGGIQ